MALLPVHNFTTQHAVNSPTFVPPPLDGSVTQPEMIDWHMQHSPHHIWACFETADGLEYVTYSALGAAIHRLARTLLERTNGKAATIGLLATVDTLTYAAIMGATLRAGCRCFLISSRNSLAAVEHLLGKCECAYLICGTGDAQEQALVRGIIQSGVPLELIPAPRYSDIFRPVDQVYQPLPPMQHPLLDSVAVIIHSSGTTSFPKPIPLTHRSLLMWMRAIWYTDRDLSQERFSLQPAPPFHGMGFMYSTSFPLCCGASVASFPPRDPPVMPTPEKVIASWAKTGVTYGTGPPHNYIQWAQEPESVAFLKTLTIARCGSGPLPTAVGDYLVSQGVPLLNGWGCTEVVASLSNSAPSPLYGKDWEYIELNNYVDPIFIPQDAEGQYYEIAFRATPSCLPSVLTNAKDQVYATSDMIEFHKTRKGFFRVVGRVDDQIMLSTGEKTNPGPLETIVKAHVAVKNAIYFGRARFNNGILVQPVSSIPLDDVSSRVAFRNLIWPAVEKANTYAPQHSRVFKEMILITAPDKPFLLTPKGTVQRPAVLAAYEQEINTIYKLAQDAAETQVQSPDWNDVEDVQRYIVDVVNEVMCPASQKSIAAKEDLFDAGCDSLQATFIRNRLLAGLNNSGFPTRDIPINILYRFTTCTALRDYLFNYVSSGCEVTATIDHNLRSVQLEAEISRHVKGLATPSGKLKTPTQTTVMITGTTGTLGSYLLRAFAESPAVKTVFCLDRGNGDLELTKKRVHAALADRGISLSAEAAQKVRIFEVDLAVPGWKITREAYAEMLENATAIIHNAWRLDFNMGLKAFEPNIIAMRHLVDFAIASPFEKPPRILNTSSVSAVSMSTTLPVPETRSPTGSNAPTGYGESKLISERILEAAVKESSLECCNVRIGQLAGSRTNGAWNTTDWVPLLLQSAPTSRCLPASNAPITWLPTDVAAQVILDIAMAPKMPLYCHLIHPKPLTWSPFVRWFARKLGASIVSQTEWIAAMGKTDIKTNPALRLASYFTARPMDPKNGREVLGIPTLETTQTCSVSPTLRTLQPLTEKDFSLWLSYWQAHGILGSHD